MDKYKLIEVSDETRKINMPVLDEDVRDRGLEEFGLEGDHGKVVTIDVCKSVYICPICEEENVMVMVNNRIIFGSSSSNDSKGGEMCVKCSSLPKEEIDARFEATEGGMSPLWRTKEELEHHTIIIDAGDVFWGQVEDFGNCFFSNCSEDFIVDWCAENGWSLRIMRGIVQPPRTE